MYSTWPVLCDEDLDFEWTLILIFCLGYGEGWRGRARADPGLFLRRGRGGGVVSSVAVFGADSEILPQKPTAEETREGGGGWLKRKFNGHKNPGWNKRGRGRVSRDLAGIGKEIFSSGLILDFRYRRGVTTPHSSPWIRPCRGSRIWKLLSLTWKIQCIDGF